MSPGWYTPPRCMFVIHQTTAKNFTRRTRLVYVIALCSYVSYQHAAKRNFSHECKVSLTSIWYFQSPPVSVRRRRLHCIACTPDTWYRRCNIIVWNRMNHFSIQRCFLTPSTYTSISQKNLCPSLPPGSLYLCNGKTVRSHHHDWQSLSSLFSLVRWQPLFAWTQFLEDCLHSTVRRGLHVTLDVSLFRARIVLRCCSVSPLRSSAVSSSLAGAPPLSFPAESYP